MQAGFFDLDDRYRQLDKLGDPLPKLDEVVDWEGFRPVLARIREKARKSAAGRKPYDVVLMFKVLVLQHLYNLADEQVEYQIRDRYSFSRFLGLYPGSAVPDARTVWLFREQLKELELVDELFAELALQIDTAGFVSRQGQIIDASIVEAPRQRNRRDENEAIKRGESPAQWEEQPAKKRQKDVEARWTKKHGKSHYGYKNHVSIDRRNKVIRHFEVTDAAVHDSQVFDVLIDETNSSRDIWADSAYRSKEREEALRERGYRSKIHRKGTANKPLSERAQEANRKRSQVRARVEHIFAAQQAMGGKLVRTIGFARARVKIAFVNLVYNMRRLVWLVSQPAV